MKMILLLLCNKTQFSQQIICTKPWFVSEGVFGTLKWPINPLSHESDENQFSHNDINT